MIKFNLHKRDKERTMKKIFILLQVSLISMLLAACSSMKVLEETEQKTIKTEESPKAMEKVAEEEIEDEYADLPKGMYIPDSEEAQMPELTHFDYKYYMEPSRTYTEKEKEILEKKEERGIEVMCISSWDVSEYLECYFSVVAEEEYHFAIEKAYKQNNSNLYIGDLISYQDTVIGKFIVSYQGEKATISIQYYNRERDRKIGAFLKEGVHYYEQYTISLEEKAIEKAGNPVMAEDYSSYSGKWFEDYLSFDTGFKDSYIELHISLGGEISGNLSHYEGDENDCSYAEFSGAIADGIGSAEYAEDGYGHSGRLTFTFCENGIILYVDEHGKPGVYGFNTGNNYYFRE